MNAAGKRWMEFAHQDLRMAELALKEGIHNQVCFHSHQCVEKCLKAVLANCSIKPPRTHSIIDLLGLAPARYFDDIYNQHEQNDIYYIPTRYPDILPGALSDGLPGRDEALEAISTARACTQMVITKDSGE